MVNSLSLPDRPERRFRPSYLKPEDPESLQLVSPRVGGKAEWIAGGSFLLIASSLYLFLYWIPYGGISTPATRTKAAAYVKQLLLGCSAYAADHEDGAYPLHLGVLYPDYVDTPEIFFAQDSDGKDIPILYYPGFTRASDPEAILIEHPVQYGGNRIIATVGGQVQSDPVD